MSKSEAIVSNDAVAPQISGAMIFSWPEISKDSIFSQYVSIPAHMKHIPRACADQTTRPGITSRRILWRNSLWRSLLLCPLSRRPARAKRPMLATGLRPSRPRFMWSLYRSKADAKRLQGQGKGPASHQPQEAACVMAATPAVITNLCALFQWQSVLGCDNLALQRSHYVNVVAPPITFSHAGVTAPSENRSLSQCPNFPSCSPLAQPLRLPHARARRQSLHRLPLRSSLSRPQAKAGSDRAACQGYFLDRDLEQAAFSQWGQPC
jgi:hypothetical protein